MGTRGGLVNKSPGLGCGDVQARLRQSLGAWWASICPIVDQRRLRALEAEARLWCVWASAHAQLLVAAVARSALGDRPCCSIVDQRRLRALEAEARLWCVWPVAHAQLLLAAVAAFTAAAAAVSAAPAAAAAGALRTLPTRVLLLATGCRRCILSAAGVFSCRSRAAAMILIDLARHGTSAVKAVSVGLHARARHGRRRCDGAGGRARIPPTVQRGGPHCPRWQRSAGWSWSWGASLQAAPMAAVAPARPELRPHDRPCFSRGAPCPMPASHPPRRLLPASAPLVDHVAHEPLKPKPKPSLHPNPYTRNHP